jgi:hypothetical protein
MRDKILMIVFFRDIFVYMFFLMIFSFWCLMFHIFIAVFLISMSRVHVSHHIIYLYKVVPIKFVSLAVSTLMFILIKTEIF